jgi:hypothetical protein
MLVLLLTRICSLILLWFLLFFFVDKILSLWLDSIFIWRLLIYETRWSLTSINLLFIRVCLLLGAVVPGSLKFFIFIVRIAWWSYPALCTLLIMINWSGTWLSRFIHLWMLKTLIKPSLVKISVHLWLKWNTWVPLSMTDVWDIGCLGWAHLLEFYLYRVKS